jgi:L-rhamnonate dehydratase
MNSDSLFSMPAGSRRTFLRGAAATAFATMSPSAFTQATGARPSVAPSAGSLTIQGVEIFELHGSYQEEGGVNHQSQVNPLDVYDQFRKPPYADKPSAMRTVKTNAIYVRIRTSAGVDGLYGPIEKAAALILSAELKPFLIGKDALAGEALWDQMYRSNRQSRDGIFMMAISAADNACGMFADVTTESPSTVCWADQRESR